MSQAPDIAPGRLPPERYAAQLRRPASAPDPREARVAAERCLFCYDAPCIEACPTSIDIPLFIRQIATGNPLGAAKTILDANIMGGMCARVCPTETLCEEACVRETAEGKPVEIGRLQRYATDALFASGRQLFAPGAADRHDASPWSAPARPASPAPTSSARSGHAVTVFEARDKPGGLNEYGIAAYKTVDDFAQTRGRLHPAVVGGIELRMRHARSAATSRSPSCAATTTPCSWAWAWAPSTRSASTAKGSHGVMDAVALHRGAAPGAGSGGSCRSAAASSSSAAA